MSPNLPPDTASGEPLPPDAHLRAALRHAPDAQAQPGPALRAAIVRAAHEAVRAGAPPAPHAAPGAWSALGELWRRFWQAPAPARPVWAAGLAAAVVASLTLTLWWGEPVPPPVRTEPPLPAPPPPPAPEAAAPQAQSRPATQGPPPAAALGSTSAAPAREAVAPAEDASEAAVAAPARKARAESPAVRPTADARPRAAPPATVPPAAPAIDTAAQSRDQAGPADERTAAPPASPPMAAPTAAPMAAPMAKAAEATGNTKAENAAMARRQSGAAQAVAADRIVASLPPTLAQRAATGEPWRTLARLSWQPADPTAASADPSPSATWQREPGGMLWREPDGRQWFAPIAPAEWPALDAALQLLRRSDVAPAAPASPAPPR